MNDPAVKLALAISIVLGGILTAIAFRYDSSAPKQDAPSWSDLTAIENNIAQEQAVIQRKNAGPAAHSLQPSSAGNAASRRPASLDPLDNPPVVPKLASRYPGDSIENASGMGAGLVPVANFHRAESGSRVHKIVDGDTLPALATKYLGSADRAMEIFQANREALSDPELLPIGVELKIPE
jgi:nucleoid-associated protein YgaU